MKLLFMTPKKVKKTNQMKNESMFLKPTKEQLAIGMDDRVSHTRWGIGTVKAEWGSWYACRECYSPVSTNWAVCPICSKSIVTESGAFLPLRVTASDTVDVEFEKDGKTRSINKVWLAPATWIPDPKLFITDVVRTPFIGRRTAK